MPSTVKQQLEASPEQASQSFLLFAILREILFLLLSLAKGNISLRDARTRFQIPPPDYSNPADSDRGESPLPEVQSEATYDGSEHAAPPTLVSAIQLLCRAIVQRDVKAASHMLEAAPHLAGKRHEGGWFPLHAAVLSGDIELVRLVLSYPQADPNATYNAPKSNIAPTIREYELGTRFDDTIGATPLHYASLIGNVEIIRLLVERGARLTAQDDMEREPIDYCDIQSDLGASSVLRDLFTKWKEHQDFIRGYNAEDLAQLIRDDQYELFEKAIKRNPEVVSDMTYSYTLLHLAVVRRRRRFVELIISTDQSLVNRCDSRALYDGDWAHDSLAPSSVPHRHVTVATPLHYACLVRDMEIAKLLIEAGADWTIRDFGGRLPDDLIYSSGDNMDELKNTFANLCDAENEKRTKAEEEERRRREEEEENGEKDDAEVENNETKPDSGSDDGDTAPSKVSIDSMLSLEATIGEKLVGQRGPICLVANAIRLRESQWLDPDRPLAMLFLGSSGVGKTELAKQLALFIHGKDGLSQEGESISQLERDHGFVRLDMSEYQKDHTCFNLIGSPKSYCGYGDGGALTQPLKKNPKAIVLLDEIEKAHPDVLTLFLQVFDDGRITDSKDGVISCKDAIFIMTSNIAAEEIKEAAPRLRRCITQAEEEDRPESYVHLIQDFTRSIRPQLKKHLKRDEFVGRINQIAVFLPLSQEEIELTVHRELETWRKRAEEKHKITLTWTDEVVHKLAAAYDINYGVRSVVNEVQRIAMHLVADAYIRGRISDGWQATLAINEVGDIIMVAVANTESIPAPEPTPEPTPELDPVAPSDAASESEMRSTPKAGSESDSVTNTEYMPGAKPSNSGGWVEEIFYWFLKRAFHLLRLGVSDSF